MRVVYVQPVHDDCSRGVAMVLVRLVEGVAGAEEACDCGRGTEERERRVARGKPAGVHGRKVDCGDEREVWEAAPRVLGVALVFWRVRTGQGHTPPVTLRKICGGHCEELVLRQKHIGHFVAEAHL